MTIDVKTKTISCLTCNIPAAAFVRVMHLSNAIIYSLVPEHFENPVSSKNNDIWYLSKEPGSKLLKWVRRLVRVSLSRRNHENCFYRKSAPQNLPN
jgi:hypothetical protein